LSQKKASEPSADLTPVKRKKLEIRHRWVPQSGYAGACQYGSLHQSPSAGRKRGVNRVFSATIWSGWIQCSLRFGIIRAPKNSRARLRRN